MKVFFFKPIIVGPETKKFNVRGLAIVSHDSPAKAAEFLKSLPSRSKEGSLHWQYSHTLQDLNAPVPKLHAMHIQFAVKQ